jgi:integrase
MTITARRNGTEIAEKDRPTSHDFADAPGKLRTLDDLIRELSSGRRKFLLQKHLPNMLTVCSHLSNFLGKAADELSLLEVLEFQRDFRAFLTTRQNTQSTIQTYVANLKRLLTHARLIGWDPAKSLPIPWQRLFTQAHDSRVRRLILHLSKTRHSPAQITEVDMDRWVYSMVAKAGSFRYFREAKRLFLCQLRDSGETSKVLGSIRQESRYGIPLSGFPSALQKEVKDLLSWKLAAIALGRPKKGKLRPISAAKLQKTLSCLYGFAVNVLGRTDITSLMHLVDQEFLTSYAEWKITRRGCKGSSIFQDVALVLAAVRHYPSFSSFDKTWFSGFLNTIPTEGDEESLKERKNTHYLEYNQVESIADELRQHRQHLEKSKRGNPAELATEELLMRFLCTLAWRQRNLRTCRICGASPNLFKAPIPRNVQITKPDWVKLEEQRNPGAEFWQFRFSSQETKAKRPVHSVLPHQLVVPLEEYLQLYRPKLAREDSEVLFVKRYGGEFTASELTNVVETLTIRYRGVRVNPHHFRDIFAYAWLEANPDNLPGLSKALWHLSVDFTMRKYAARYNESSAVCAIEKWLERRAAERR